MIELFPRAFNGMPSRKAAGGVSLFSGTLPNTVAALNGWTLASPWTVLHNFTSATVGPSACSSATGSETLNLIKLGSDNTATLESAGQGGYATQGGYTVNTNQDFMYTAPAASWRFSATVPTAYLATIKFDGTPANGQTFLGGSDGGGGGWWLEAHSTSGIRAAVGSGGGYVNTSYVGGTSLYDGEYHTIMLVIDDAAGKAKIFTEFGNTESTGLTLASGSAYYTLGPVGAGLTWGTAVTYLLSARGEHPLLYTNAQSLFDEYEDARLNNVNQTAIAGLPTAISDLNSVTGLTFTNGWNISSASSNAPLTGASGPTLVPDTGTLRGGGTGTQPTLAAAPQIRTSFTSQSAALFDSDEDNFGVAGALPASDFTMLLVWKAPASFVSGASIAGLVPSVASTSGWQLHVSSGNTRFFTYHTSGSYTQAFVAVDTSTGGLWHVIMVRAATGGLLSRIVVNTTANSSSAIPALTADSAQPGNLGSHNNNAIVNGALAFTAWLSGQTSDANMTTAIANFRWRYGL